MKIANQTKIRNKTVNCLQIIHNLKTLVYESEKKPGIVPIMRHTGPYLLCKYLY